MAQKILIMGESGTGKTTSLRNLNPALTAIVNPVGKPMPFKENNGKFTVLNNETKSSHIVAWMRGQVNDGKKIIIVDDFQYLLSLPYMNRIREPGWDKWNDFGADYFSIINVCAELSDDVRVYYLTHTETLDSGVTTIKLIGKMLREKITIEGLFTIVLRTSVVDQKYYFLTQNSGKDTVKSPIGMFPDYSVENDLAYVDDKICNYYEIGNYKSDEEMREADKAAAGDIVQPKAGRRPRGSAKTREEVEQANMEAVGDYVKKMGEVVEEIAGDREEVPFEEVTEAAKNIPAPETEKLPRRTRKERAIEPKGNAEAEQAPADAVIEAMHSEPATTGAPTRRRRTRS